MNKVQAVSSRIICIFSNDSFSHGIDTLNLNDVIKKIFVCVRVVYDLSG